MFALPPCSFVPGPPTWLTQASVTSGLSFHTFRGRLPPSFLPSFLWALHSPSHAEGFPGGFPPDAVVKNPPSNAGDQGEMTVRPLSGEDPLEEGIATAPVFLPRQSSGQRSLVNYSPGGPEEPDASTAGQQPCRDMPGMIFLPALPDPSLTGYPSAALTSLGCCRRPILPASLHPILVQCFWSAQCVCLSHTVSTGTVS